MLVQHLERLRKGVDPQRRHGRPDPRIGHEGKIGDVVEMGMGKHDIADRVELLQLQIAHAAPGVEQQALIHQQGSGPLPSPDAAAGPQGAELHGLSPIPPSRLWWAGEHSGSNGPL